MIILKDFFRRKTSKISILIFVFLIFIIQLVFSFKNYYENFITKTYKDNTYLLIKANSDFMQDLKNNKNISDVENIILFNPDFSTNFNYNFLLDPQNSDIVVLKDTNNILEYDQCILEISNELFDSNLKDKNITFNYKSNIINLDIFSIRKGVFSRVILSQKRYDDLKKNSYNYIANINDYKNINKIFDEIKSNTEIKELTLVHAYQKIDTINTVIKYEKVLSTLNKGLLIMGIIFSLIYIIVLKNIITDELESMKIEKMIGFNNQKIFAIVLSKIILSNIIAFITANIFYIIISILLNLYKINLKVLNFSLLQNIISLILIISFSLCFIYCIILNHKMIKKD